MGAPPPPPPPGSGGGGGGGGRGFRAAYQLQVLRMYEPPDCERLRGIRHAFDSKCQVSCLRTVQMECCALQSGSGAMSIWSVEVLQESERQMCACHCPCAPSVSRARSCSSLEVPAMPHCQRWTQQGLSGCRLVRCISLLPSMRCTLSAHAPVCSRIGLVGIAWYGKKAD